MRRILIGTLFLITVMTIVYSCQDASKMKQDVFYTNGRDYYIKYCQNCHGAKGEGLGELAPPLTDSVFLKANRQNMACYIKNGMSAPVTIHGKTYEGNKMPGFANLADIDIAQIIVYVTNSFGNKQGMYTPEQVFNDLQHCK